MLLSTTGWLFVSLYLSVSEYMVHVLAVPPICHVPVICWMILEVGDVILWETGQNELNKSIKLLYLFITLLVYQICRFITCMHFTLLFYNDMR